MNCTFVPVPIKFPVADCDDDRRL